MVNIKKVGLLLVFNLTSSCACDYYITSMGGLRSKRNYKSYEHKRINPEEINLDLNSIYENIFYKYYEETDKMSPIKDSSFLKKYSFIKFFKNGTYYEYIFGRDKILNRNDLNPLKGNFSYIIKKNNKNIFMNYSAVDCGRFSENEYKLKEDTLMISAGSNKGYRTWYYYLKKEVPKDWINWKPDM